MRTTFFLLACTWALTACGGKAAAPTTTSNHGQPPAATIADDVDAIAKVVAGAPSKDWPQRVTVLGWTADHKIAFRSVICAVDELGGRGDWCDFDICTMGVSGPVLGDPICSPAASLELYDPSGFVAADVTAAAEAATTELGALTPGKELPLAENGISVAKKSMYHEAAGQPRRLVVAAYALEGVEPMGVSAFHVAAVSQSPDGACIAAVGTLDFEGEYEGIEGDVPRAFASVMCKP